jgi:hypothetical protein
LSNRALLVNNLYAGNKVVSAVGMKPPPHDWASAMRSPADNGIARTWIFITPIEVVTNVRIANLATGKNSETLAMSEET